MAVNVDTVTVLGPLLVFLGSCADPATHGVGDGATVPQSDASDSLDAGLRALDAVASDSSQVDAPVSGSDASSPPKVGPYVSSLRTIPSGGADRGFVLVHPDPMPAGLPLVIAFHGDGGSGQGLRTSLPLERSATTGAVFVYPNAVGGTFEYWTSEGRAREAVFIEEVIALLADELGVDSSRVFLAGMSGGATMANALGCRLGSSVIAGLGIHSGTLYPVDVSDFGYTDTGGVTCALPPVIFVWGENDRTSGVSFAQGESVRDNYLATAGCDAASVPWSVAECQTYEGCSASVVWCPIPGLGHSIWSGAAGAIWNFFDHVR